MTVLNGKKNSRKMAEFDRRVDTHNFRDSQNYQNEKDKPISIGIVSEDDPKKEYECVVSESEDVFHRTGSGVCNL